jgi:hypothetical protein
MTGASGRRVLEALESRFPQWAFRFVAGRNGRNIEAVRKGTGPGVYAVISSDPEEINEELRAALPGGPV